MRFFSPDFSSPTYFPHVLRPRATTTSFKEIEEKLNVVLALLASHPGEGSEQGFTPNNAVLPFMIAFPLYLSLFLSSLIEIVGDARTQCGAFLWIRKL
jgi:hypothetical protein